MLNFPTAHYEYENRGGGGDEGGETELRDAAATQEYADEEKLRTAETINCTS